MKTHRIIISFILAFFIVSQPATFSFAEDRPYEVLSILFFNDIHGHLEPFKIRTNKGKEEVGGIARLAFLIKKIRSENNGDGYHTYVLSAGDFLQGTPMSTVFKGEPDVKCFNLMGLDAMTVGNHEFDFGVKNFLELKKQAEFPFISANIAWQKSGELLNDPFAVFKLTEKISLSVIGVTTAELMTTTKPDHVKDLKLIDSIKTVKKRYRKLKSKGPVLLLSHSKFKTDSAIAMALPGLTAIIGGHDQILFNPYREVNGVPIFQAFEKGKFLGRVDFKVHTASKKAEMLFYRYYPITSAVDFDPEISGIVKKYHKQMDSKFKEVIGESKSYLNGDRGQVRYEETSLGNFVTDIMCENTGAEISFINSGSLRSSIDIGKITVEDVFKSMPYANEIVLVKLNGREILQILKRSVKANRGDEDGGFLQVSGIRFMIKGRDVEKVTLGEKPENLVLDREYTVAITDFMASGGDGYTMLKDKTLKYTGLPLRELIVDTIRTQGPVESKVEGRITRYE